MRSALFTIIAVAVLLVATAFSAVGQRSSRGLATKSKTATPVVTQIDVDGLKALLKPDGKPRLVNFWATWCDPCREEFPELVKLDATYKGRIDLITVSLDEVADIRTAVPKFLLAMRSLMPAYLLNAGDEDAAIAAIGNVSGEFHGSLPFTVLLTPSGGVAYSKAGKINPTVLNDELAKQAALAK